MGKHTILLLQPQARKDSRTFHDFPSVNESVDYVVKMYERELKAMNPHVHHITYDIQHLLKYVDELHDVSALVYDSRTGQYSPHGKDWIKQHIFDHLRSQAAAAGGGGGNNYPQGGRRR